MASQTGGFPIFAGKVLNVSWTLSEMFLVGPFNRPRKGEKRQIGNDPEEDRENPCKRTTRRKIGTDESNSGNPPFQNPSVPASLAFKCRFLFLFPEGSANCENLRFSAKICGFLRCPAPSKCRNFQEKGRICENLRFSAKI